MRRRPREEKGREGRIPLVQHEEEREGKGGEIEIYFLQLHCIHVDVSYFCGNKRVEPWLRKQYNSVNAKFVESAFATTAFLRAFRGGKAAASAARAPFAAQRVSL